MMTGTKAKLVPCRLNSPEPTGPMRRDWMKVATPETISDMEIRKGTRSPRSSAWPMINVGVAMATTLASRCCTAASRLRPNEGRSSRR